MVGKNIARAPWRSFGPIQKAALVLIAIGTVGMVLDSFMILPMIFSPIFWLGVGMITLSGVTSALRQRHLGETVGFRGNKVQHALFIASLFVWSLLIVSIAVNALWVPTFEEVGHVPMGCYLTDALWFYVRCRGFAFAGATAFFLTIPYTLLLGPTLLVWNPAMGIPLWFFLIFPVWYVWQQRRAV